MITKHNKYDVHDDVEAIVAHVSTYMWMVAEVAADKMTTAESADVRAAIVVAAEKAALKAIVQMAAPKTPSEPEDLQMADRDAQVSAAETFIKMEAEGAPATEADPLVAAAQTYAAETIARVAADEPA